MVKHTSTYQIPLDPLFLRKKKSCDPLFHLALFHFRRSLDRRGSRWERCCECFKTVCNHLSKINRRSTRIKSKFLRVGWLGVVGKGLYYHRFVDVLRHGKWDEMGWLSLVNVCILHYFRFLQKFRILFLSNVWCFRCIEYFELLKRYIYEGKGIFFHFCFSLLFRVSLRCIHGCIFKISAHDLKINNF